MADVASAARLYFDLTRCVLDMTWSDVVLSGCCLFRFVDVLPRLSISISLTFGRASSQNMTCSTSRVLPICTVIHMSPGFTTHICHSTVRQCTYRVWNWHRKDHVRIKASNKQAFPSSLPHNSTYNNHNEYLHAPSNRQLAARNLISPLSHTHQEFPFDPSMRMNIHLTVPIYIFNS
ncbi:hypothetical protein P153DRAFT_141001 [Dothidotthia symphoricarpi CBS 119687]|uniref:Uncharacterized protein n=1 Tax=Dothidotthia symphoricarpi CBS 119687 TaxID=1392245 RepID=A0A6A5ZYG0_9PLEO|nr:uncharacterized protein P153DRAFT_141001 [Dothidotthia symphoricarpi CBS 119687]KAF2123913.1 hypothetical protein P153DRAFT_141001 [Dothidotthia symphoricarpi CBS 119687]